MVFSFSSLGTSFAPYSTAMEDPARKILVVDDYPQTVALLSSFLAEQGYEVACANNGRRAVEMLERGRFDLVLSDVSMPEMGGYELLEYVRSKFASTCVILMSGDFTLGRPRLIYRGPEAFLTKPLDLNKLLEAIQSALEPEHGQLTVNIPATSRHKRYT